MAQLFEQSKKVIEAQLAGTSIRAIAGSMVAYEGNVQFKSAGFGGGEGVLAGLTEIGDVLANTEAVAEHAVALLLSLVQYARPLAGDELVDASR